MRKNEDKVLEFLEDLVQKGMQWDNLAQKPNALTSTNKDGIYTVDSFIATKAKIATPCQENQSVENSQCTIDRLGKSIIHFHMHQLWNSESYLRGVFTLNKFHGSNI